MEDSLGSIWIGPIAIATCQLQVMSCLVVPSRAVYGFELLTTYLFRLRNISIGLVHGNTIHGPLATCLSLFMAREAEA